MSCKRSETYAFQLTFRIEDVSAEGTSVAMGA
jgi:hypothetical protein